MPTNRYGQNHPPIQRNPNQARRHPWWIPITAGAAALVAAGAIGYSWLSGSENNASNAAPAPSGTASAPQYPGDTLPTSATPYNPNTTSASPSPTETTASASPSASKDTDPHKAARQQAAHIITGCTVDFFSNGGIHGTGKNKYELLNLDVTTDRDSSADDAHVSDMKTSGAQVVLRKVSDSDFSTRYDNAIEHGQPGNTDAHLPTKLAGHTVLAVTIESTATVDGITTTDTWLCGGNGLIENLGGDGANDWRPATDVSFDQFPAFTTVDAAN